MGSQQLPTQHVSKLELCIDIQKDWSVPQIMRFIQQSMPRAVNEALHVDAGSDQCTPYFQQIAKRPLRNFASLLDFSQSALCFDRSFQFVILHLVISVCTQFHRLYFGLLLVDLHDNYCLILTFLLLSIQTHIYVSFNNITLLKESFAFCHKILALFS
jgi:hypothetical protein